MSTSSRKIKNPAFIIMKRELKSNFTSPIPYIVTGFFIFACSITFFNTFFLNNRAELRNFFSILPIVLSIFIPALTMRIFSEEKRVGSIETLMTLPVTEFHVVLGKYLACFIGTLIMLCPSLFYVLTVQIFGSPDYGIILGGYAGAILLCASFSAVGLFASSITKNQIIAFFVAFIICIALSLIDMFMIFLPGSLVRITTYLSANQHFSSISRGIFDTRDLIYFISLAAFFFALTVKVEKSNKL